MFTTAKRRLERAMVAAAWSGAEEADIAMLTIDSSRGIDGDGDLDIISIGWGHGKVLLYENKAIDNQSRVADGRN